MGRGSLECIPLWQQPLLALTWLMGKTGLEHANSYSPSNNSLLAATFCEICIAQENTLRLD